MEAKRASKTRFSHQSHSNGENIKILAAVKAVCVSTKFSVHLKLYGEVAHMLPRSQAFI